MLKIRILLLFLLNVLFCCSQENAPNSSETTEFDNQYSLLETAMAEGKTFKEFSEAQLEDFQVKLIQKMVENRVQVVLHMKNNFENKENEQWAQCIEENADVIQQMEMNYTNLEGECAKVSLKIIDRKRSEVDFLVKEIQHWMKGYKYLMKICNNQNNISNCLQGYIEQENFDERITELRENINRFKVDLQNRCSEELVVLQNCLEGHFSIFMDTLRDTVVALQACYEKSKVAKDTFMWTFFQTRPH